MAIHVQLDNYQLVRDKTTLLPKYVGFNVLLESDEGVGVLMCDWRLQDGLLYPPWKRTGPRGFFTHTYVSETIARKIREQAVADLSVMAGDDPEIPVLDTEEGWKPSMYSPTNFKRMMPALYKEKYSDEAPPRIEGHKRALSKPTGPAATRAVPQETLPREIARKGPSEASTEEEATSSPYPSRLTYEAMQDASKRPSWIPERIRFVGLDDVRLHWSKERWEEQERKMAAIRASD